MSEYHNRNSWPFVWSPTCVEKRVSMGTINSLFGGNLSAAGFHELDQYKYCHTYYQSHTTKLHWRSLSLSPKVTSRGTHTHHPPDISGLHGLWGWGWEWGGEKRWPNKVRQAWLMTGWVMERSGQGTHRPAILNTLLSPWEIGREGIVNKTQSKRHRKYDSVWCPKDVRIWYRVKVETTSFMDVEKIYILGPNQGPARPDWLKYLRL